MIIFVRMADNTYRRVRRPQMVPTGYRILTGQRIFLRCGEEDYINLILYFYLWQNSELTLGDQRTLRSTTSRTLVVTTALLSRGEYFTHFTASSHATILRPTSLYPALTSMHHCLDRMQQFDDDTPC